MNLRMTLVVPALLGMACLLGGCETECYKMTDGGPVGKGIDSWKLEDKEYADELMPQLRRYWAREKSKWPIFVKKCEDSGTCYEKSIADAAPGASGSDEEKSAK